MEMMVRVVWGASALSFKKEHGGPQATDSTLSHRPHRRLVDILWGAGFDRGVAMMA